MAEFPGLETILDSSLSGKEAKELFRRELTATHQLPGAEPVRVVAISNGILTPSLAFTVVDAEGSANMDDLELIAITNTHDGMELKLVAQDSRTITVRHRPNAVYGISLAAGADITLSTTRFLSLKRYGDRWREMVDGSTHSSIPVAIAAVQGISRPDKP